MKQVYEDVKAWFSKYGAMAYGALVALLLGVIFFLKNKTNGLQSQNARLKAEAEMGAILGKLEEQKQKADSAQSNYEHVRDAYRDGVREEESTK